MKLTDLPISRTTDHKTMHGNEFSVSTMKEIFSRMPFFFLKSSLQREGKQIIPTLHHVFSATELI